MLREPLQKHRFCFIPFISICIFTTTRLLSEIFIVKEQFRLPLSLLSFIGTLVLILAAPPSICLLANTPKKSVKIERCSRTQQPLASKQEDNIPSLSFSSVFSLPFFLPLILTLPFKYTDEFFKTYLNHIINNNLISPGDFKSHHCISFHQLKGGCLKRFVNLFSNF